jgi:hypothetical protein
LNTPHDHKAENLAFNNNLQDEGLSQDRIDPLWAVKSVTLGAPFVMAHDNMSPKQIEFSGIIWNNTSGMTDLSKIESDTIMKCTVADRAYRTLHLLRVNPNMFLRWSFEEVEELQYFLYAGHNVSFLSEDTWLSMRPNSRNTDGRKRKLDQSDSSSPLPAKIQLSSSSSSPPSIDTNSPGETPGAQQ